MAHVDVVVVGGGSSGGVVASRLTEDPSRTVLLLEAGPDFPDELDFPPSFVTGGSQFHNQVVNEHDWGYWSEPLTAGGGRSIRLPRGRMVGGSSMTNFTQCVRGAPSDFERWEREGAAGWGYEDIRPFYERVETTGINIKRHPRHSWQPIQEAFYDGFVELGYREVEDMNAPESWRGVVGQMPQNRLNEVRGGTLVTYLRAARGRENLEIRGNALVERVLFDGTRATGVRYVDEGGRPQEVTADLVVISAGAYNSPTILLRSGLGPADELSGLGIDTLVDLPTGRSLFDHGAFFFELDAPDLTEVRSPAGANFSREPGNRWMAMAASLDEASGTCLVCYVLASGDAPGAVTLNSIDPTVAPTLRHDYDLTGAEDTLTTLQALMETKALAGRATMRDRGRPLGEIIAERLGTAYHPVGTCGIGRVVDPELNVLGTEGLKVVDASVFPTHVSNNPNLTCYMIGERAASLIKGEPLTSTAAATG
jgi:choline dehydrogenase